MAPKTCLNYCLWTSTGKEGKVGKTPGPNPVSIRGPFSTELSQVVFEQKALLHNEMLDNTDLREMARLEGVKAV